MLDSSLFWVVNAVGLAAFALVGASKAIREGFDPFGVTVVGLVTAFGGGTTRDLLVLRVPLSLQTLTNIGFGMLGVILAVVLSVYLRDPDRHPFSLAADAIGLGAFATTGAIVATNVGVSPFGVIAIATINAVGGGAFADILLDRPPFILLEDFYASCALLGGCTYWVISMTAGGGLLAAGGCAGITVGTRLVAVRYEWELPNIREYTIDTTR
ncbi:trimeric intracellular cation channel family protein [Halomicroarcula limicola]|uniref:Trimeric intracellular cation channel family protein n=1 Tax=Haloarcula limicola TaxID=1429915 RepID=A0A8J8CA02_9EURY|nr:trimeric intracellular cation channel family protein [Halomicroarcula limicola]MBV0925990.1 trimeric intracellular cation channel family protein [Halomicroarcula limicola]